MKLLPMIFSMLYLVNFAWVSKNMDIKPQNPLIIQSDRSVLLETTSPLYEQVRDYLHLFAELIKSPEYVHTYRITPLSIWNAASANISLDSILDGLKKYAKFPVPENVIAEIKEYYQIYGKLKLVLSQDPEKIILQADDELLMAEILHHKKVRGMILSRLSSCEALIHKHDRGWIKEALIKRGFPVEDLVGYDEGEKLSFSLKTGDVFTMRKYQEDSINTFCSGGMELGGSGVIVLPCGAGKTIVGMGIIERLQTSTLVIVNNIEAASQWKNELLNKTTLTEEQVGEYHSGKKNIRPITIATYNIVTYRKHKDEDFVHLGIFDKRNWGLIVYDEVHLLPAPIFQISATLQAKRRLGLTATLIREDGREDEVFSLIGPKKYDVPWKILERQGWIARAYCTEYRIPLTVPSRQKYVASSDREKFKIASCNPRKKELVWEIMQRHREAHILIIGQYLQHLKEISEEHGLPLITGATSHKKRKELYDKFRRGIIKKLVVSKVANFSIDLPDANVAIQISGTFGSRQEEAQRLGRILRPKQEGKPAEFYTIISRDTSEQRFAMKRQLFLVEQGYRYTIQNFD